MSHLQSGGWPAVFRPLSLLILSLTKRISSGSLACSTFCLYRPRRQMLASMGGMRRLTSAFFETIDERFPVCGNCPDLGHHLDCHQYADRPGAGAGVG